MIFFLFLVVCRASFFGEFVNGFYNGSSLPLTVVSEEKNCSVHNAVEVCLGNDTSVISQDLESLYFTTLPVGRYNNIVQKTTEKKTFFF